MLFRSAMLVPGLGGLGIAGRLILGSYEFVCGCFDRLPFHTWNPGCPKIWQIVVYYLLLCGAIGIRIHIKRLEEVRQGKMPNLNSKSRPKINESNRNVIGNALFGDRIPDIASVKRGRSGGGSGDSGLKVSGVERFRFKTAGNLGSTVILTLAVLLFAIRSPAENSVTFLDVGQGDCILLRTASGEVYLFDCGSSSRKNIGKYILVPCLKYNGIHTIDAVFLSHPDADHINGAVELLGIGGENNITVNQMLLPDIEESEKEEQLGKLLEAAAEASQKEPVSVGYLSAGDEWDCGSASFICLHPAKGFSAADANAYSECFLVEFTEGQGGIFRGGKTGGGTERRNWTLLLTGDVQEKGEEAFSREIQERGIGGITVLKAAHHGSRNSTPKELLDRLKPLLTVISCGRDNRYGHPHAELMERLEASGTAIVQTAWSGAVTVTWQDGGLAVSGMAE